MKKEMEQMFYKFPSNDIQDKIINQEKSLKSIRKKNAEFIQDFKHKFLAEKEKNTKGK